MIKIELTPQQLSDLLKHNHAQVEVSKDMPIYRCDNVQAGERVCHVRGVTDNPHWSTKTVYLTMRCGL